MFRYADRDACPACRHAIDRTGPACGTCGVELLGPPARTVFAALQEVDRLVAELPAHGAEPVEPAASTTIPTAVPTATRTATPTAATYSALSAASVPKILLGLGALCLLVASIVFLVVAWATLGVGGRTGVLVGFTVVATVLLAVVAHRGLRAGAEAFAAVVLGLLAIDLGGAREAGWLRTIDDPWFLVVVGSAVALAGTGIASWSRGTRVRRLVSAEAGAALAVAAVAVGVGTIPGGGYEAEAALAATLVCLAAAVAARWLRLDLLTLGTRLVVVLAWSVLTATAAERLVPQSVEHVWLDLAVWPALAAAALAALVATQTYLPLWSRVAAAAAAVGVAAVAVTVVGFDESATTVALVELGVIAVCAGVVAAMRSPVWGWAVVVPSVGAASALAASVLMMVATSVQTVVPSAVWLSGATAALPGPDIPWTWPLLLPAGVVGICVCVATVLACRGDDPRLVVVPGASLAVAAAVLVPPLYGVPLLAAVVAMVVAAAALGVAAVLTARTALAVPAAGVLGVALVTGLASEWTTLVALTAVLAAALVVERLPGVVMSVLGIVLVPAATAGLLWTVGEIAGLPQAWQALPVMVVLGLDVVRRPGIEREVAHALAAGVAVAGSVAAGGVLLETWLAVYLTLGGVVAAGSALVNASRRRLAHVGLGFFAAAHWVRLHDVGVDTVEAYTLPLAVVLLVIGCVSLVVRTDSSVRALGPGLALALVPTLMIVLAEPVGLRAILLGLACLVLVAIGVVGHLAAPLVAGALVGALVVLRQGSLAEVLPQWAIIGLVGIGLTVVGITWEQRLQEMRRASAYVRGLR